MKKITVLFSLVILLFGINSCSEQQLNAALKGTQTTLSKSAPLTNTEVIAGLKEALNYGTDASVNTLTKTDGFFKDEAVKIVLPPEAQTIYKNLSKVPGINTYIDKTILAMNRAAEDAAKQAKPIFVNAIKGITINDGFSILNGGENAATNYLKSKTYTSLVAAYKPQIETSLGKPLVAGVSAEKAYKNLIDVYNTASLGGTLFAKINNNSLSQYVTEKGLDGLFLKVADQEKKIRMDPVAQVTDLLRKVFGKK